MSLTTWRLLLERYAIRAREHSEAVAFLGTANLPPAECGELLETIKARRESCMAVEEEVNHYIKQDAAAAHAP